MAYQVVFKPYEAKIEKTHSIRVFMKGKIDTITLIPRNGLTVGNIVNGKLEKPKVSKTLQDTVIDLLKLDRGEKHCRNELCGTPDAMDKNIPVEIKTLVSFHKKIFEKGIEQAIMYSYIFETSKAELILGYFHPIDERKGLLQRIDIYDVIPTYIDEDYFREIKHKFE